MRCRRRGHDWFPNNGPSEFIVTRDVCLRCKAKRALLPTGQCLGGHAMAEHYTDQGELRPTELVQTCLIGRPT